MTYMRYHSHLSYAKTDSKLIERFTDVKLNTNKLSEAYLTDIWAQYKYTSNKIWSIEQTLVLKDFVTIFLTSEG